MKKCGIASGDVGKVQCFFAHGTSNSRGAHIAFRDMKRYTWRRKTPFRQHRLDYFLISDQVQDQIDQVDVIPSIQSDHSTLKLKIRKT